MNNIKFAGIVRKSPSRDRNYEDNIDLQKSSIITKICQDFSYKEEEINIDWFIDNHTSGDSKDRPELNRLFSIKEQYQYAYCDKVDRFSRSWLGLEWFMKNFTTNEDISIEHTGCKLRFVKYLPELYNKDNTINIITFLFFWDMCKNAMFELVNMRQRQRDRLQELRKNPEEWKKRWKGRKVGSKNIKRIDAK